MQTGLSWDPSLGLCSMVLIPEAHASIGHVEGLGEITYLLLTLDLHDTQTLFRV